jgi:tripartite-type tricarboxylate transporter receptor subunit TctC
MPELLALAKSRRDGLNYGSNGTGTTSHLAGAWLQLLSGYKFVHIPYKGAGASLPALIGGDVEIGFQTIGAMEPLIAAKKLRGIAVTTLDRSSVLPDLPTVASIYPGFELGNWYGFFAPTGTPVSTINKIHAETARGLQHPDVKHAILAEFQVIGSTPTEFSAFVAKEIDKYAKIIKESGAKPDG